MTYNRSGEWIINMRAARYLGMSDEEIDRAINIGKFISATVEDSDLLYSKELERKTITTHPCIRFCLNSRQRLTVYFNKRKCIMEVTPEMYDFLTIFHDKILGIILGENNDLTGTSGDNGLPAEGDNHEQANQSPPDAS